MVRKIEYTVKSTGTEPATVQFYGVQGEHRATELVFELDDELYLKLVALKENERNLIYRIDGYDGEGGLHRSDVNELSAESVSYMLEEKLTRFGGKLKILLVISLKYLDETEMELYSFPVTGQLKNLPDGRAVCGENHESMSVLAEVAKQNAETAVNARDIAVEAQGKTELARAALEGGTEWIFDGGNAKDEIDIEFAVDNAMSDSSNNPVANKVGKEYIDNLVENAIATAKLDAHPVGSLYWSSESTEPSVLFGGTWERVKDTFILAAGDKYAAGSDGGEAEVKLEIEEMPKHFHEGIYWYGSHPISLNSGTGALDGYKIDWVQGIQENHSPINTSDKGGDQPHNNMPPYIAYYCWKRTA